MTNSVAAPVIPGSEHIPFRPINAWGRTPVVKRKDGSLVDWKNPLAEQLYQVHVEDSEKGMIPVGFKMGQALCDEFCATLKIAIKSGRISGWTNPHVVYIGRQRAAARLF